MLTIVEPGYEILTEKYTIDGMTRAIELAGRTCYKSESCISSDSADRFVRRLCYSNHVSVLEHASITARITCSRACSHQLVRHRLAAYSQESQRYCNYRKKGLQFICPPSVGLEPGDYYLDHNDWLRFVDIRSATIIGTRAVSWLNAVSYAADAYLTAIDAGDRPEDARYLLPNAMKTEVVVTMNLRMWRHVIKERGLNEAAQWEIRGIFLGIFHELKELLPAVFGDLTQIC